MNRMAKRMFGVCVALSDGYFQNQTCNFAMK